MFIYTLNNLTAEAEKARYKRMNKPKQTKRGYGYESQLLIGQQLMN